MNIRPKVETKDLFGLMAVFETPEHLTDAARKAYEKGFRKLDAFSPFPVDNLFEALEIRNAWVAPICWLGGLLGAMGGFTLLTYNTVFSFPLNVGGRPLFSWPAYIPITFELMILTAGVLTFLSTLGLSRLPKYYHPVFNIPEFQKRNSNDGFFLVIEATDKKFDFHRTFRFLQAQNPIRIYEVPDYPNDSASSRLLWPLFVLILCSTGCQQKMAREGRVRSFAPNSFFSDGSSARLPVEGTIARGSSSSDDAFMKGKKNGVYIEEIPVSITHSLLERGRERYNIFCSPCHGYTGDGQGMIVSRGFSAPPSYYIDRLRNAPSGHFFNVISNGYGAMFSYGDRVSPADRWAIIAYIRALQRTRRKE